MIKEYLSNRANKCALNKEDDSGFRSRQGSDDIIVVIVVHIPSSILADELGLLSVEWSAERHDRADRRTSLRVQGVLISGATAEEPG